MIFYSRNKAIEQVNKLFDKQGKCEVNNCKELKSLSQNRYCWLVFTHIWHETGQDKDDVYNFCLQNFAPKKEVIIAGIETMTVKSLSQMNKDECSTFIDSFVVFFRTEGMDVPDPESKRALEMYSYYKEKGMI